MIRHSWIIFLHAALLSIESIIVEMLATQIQLAPLVIAANSIPLAGAVMLLISFGSEKKKSITVFQSWKYLLPGSVLLATGVFAWYDSVGRVGASKEGLLAGPLETVVILLLARAALSEKLSRLQLAGVMIALAGFFATVMSSGLDALITFGDIEAMLSATAFGSGIIFITKLAKTHSAQAVTGSSLFISGLILAMILWTTQAPAISAQDWMVLLLFSLLPLTAALTYVVGLSRIGASLTSIIGSFSIILTVVFQLALLWQNVEVILPANIPLAVAGGIMGVFGIYLIHRTKKTF
ncbi:EamA family transporter [Candidatus Nitrososphaera gargensis]|uniref:EamA family transporter n=1 Tax=Candidatus Nitrososphaera gargensis TaxID=497727 RepID=UPI00164FD547|nr:DMT family transporter [Candidatus Nitrososphaera gargensis]